MNTTENTTPKTTASYARNNYRGNTPDVRVFGYNVSLTDAGFVLMGLPENYAAKAVRLLNACESRESQASELSRIRAVLRKSEGES